MFKITTTVLFLATFHTILLFLLRLSNDYLVHIHKIKDIKICITGKKNIYRVTDN